MRKEYPLEDQTRIDKDDEMFGRGWYDWIWYVKKLIMEHCIESDKHNECEILFENYN